ncbi:MAG: class I SAM-dependent methyltransferase [Chloroflexi bacterium]|nr:class I SAM-dependent methyltransferase [Chloroflexota bacterium]
MPVRNRGPRKAQEHRPGAQGESWDHVAAWYDSLVADQGSDYHQGVVIPGVLELLGLKQGESALDVACGQGAVARAMHQAGARVTGIDLSRRLIDAARERSPREIRYAIGDARRLENVADSSFDAVVCVLAAQNIDPVEPVFARSAQVLRPGGRFVVVVNHPAFRIPRQSRWKLDEARKLLKREIDGYLTPLKIPIDMTPHRRAGSSVTFTHHRPIHAYVGALAAAGLLVNALEEWPSHRVSQPGRTSRAENHARGEFPLFLALRAVTASAPCPSPSPSPRRGEGGRRPGEGRS